MPFNQYLADIALVRTQIALEVFLPVNPVANPGVSSILRRAMRQHPMAPITSLCGGTVIVFPVSRSKAASTAVLKATPP